ncbi:histidine phosphatase superfamily [Vararia minispora EC-137]|uniref:Histidine phosphatase superfamily n=1 Tax=Vararia minispora EC-137 TaxID=1314806 RepID=A0ACB8QRW0_9AGAM|nr:histidine phosphatase superfamily [Vararia minispora EC-137]
MSNDTVLGVVLIVRHGDREGFYQDPTTYDASNTVITAAGTQQEIALGALLRQRYFNASSGNHIQFATTGLVNYSQIALRADAGDEGGVIYASAVALAQGLWPATSDANTTLSNGTTIVAPLSGYQYVPIESVESSNNIELQGFTSCPTFNSYVNNFYESDEFLAKQNESAAFLDQLPPYLDGRSVELTNMWNIFDFMNVQSIHNATFANALPSTFLPQARALANWHQYNSFSDPSLSGIGNIAMQTMLPSVIGGLQDIANASNPLNFYLEAISYKPFLSLFNMTNVAAQNTSLAGIVEYAAAVALEVRQPANGGETMLRFMFKNGSNDDFRQYGLLGSDGDVALSTFINKFNPVSVNTTSQWCSVCDNGVSRGCGVLAAAKASGATHDTISPVGAGFLGAGLTIAVFLIGLGVLALLGLLTCGPRRRLIKGSDSGSHGDEKA